MTFVCGVDGQRLKDGWQNRKLVISKACLHGGDRRATLAGRFRTLDDRNRSTLAGAENVLFEFARALIRSDPRQIIAVHVGMKWKRSTTRRASLLACGPKFQKRVFDSPELSSQR
jgi:hypothetical protein